MRAPEQAQGNIFAHLVERFYAQLKHVRQIDLQVLQLLEHSKGAPGCDTRSCCSSFSRCTAERFSCFARFMNCRQQSYLPWSMLLLLEANSTGVWNRPWPCRPLVILSTTCFVTRPLPLVPGDGHSARQARHAAHVCLRISFRPLPQQRIQAVACTTKFVQHRRRFLQRLHGSFHTACGCHRRHVQQVQHTCSHPMPLSTALQGPIHHRDGLFHAHSHDSCINQVSRDSQSGGPHVLLSFSTHQKGFVLRIKIYLQNNDCIACFAVRAQI